MKRKYGLGITTSRGQTIHYPSTGTYGCCIIAQTPNVRKLAYSFMVTIRFLENNVMDKKSQASDMPNLVSTWRKIVTNNGEKPLVTGLHTMNDALGTNYLHHRITAWEKGERRPSQDVINYMLPIVLKYLLVKSNLSYQQVQSIIEKVKII